MFQLRLGLPIGPFPSGFLTKILYAFLFFPQCVYFYYYCGKFFAYGSWKRGEYFSDLNWALYCRWKLSEPTYFHCPIVTAIFQIEIVASAQLGNTSF
jgi:hypothetical protein